MRRWNSNSLALVLLVAACLSMASPAARAACSNPPGGEAGIVYNTSTLQFQYCDGTDWIAMTPPGAGGGPLGCPNIGDVCSDGSVYAGLSPDGGVKMYTTSVDAGQFAWNNGTTNYTVTGVTSTTDGDGNTAALVALADAGAPYVAADYCDSLSAHGKADWYLPAKDELDLLYTNNAAIGGFNTSGPLLARIYWSSSEDDNFYAWVENFGIGFQGSYDKDSGSASVRCVRKGAAGGGCADPAKPEGSITYNAGHRVMQGCAGGQWRAMGPVGATGSVGTTLIATLNNPAPAADDEFGSAAALSGKLAVVGAYFDDPGGVVDAGTAYVFDITTGNLVSTLNNPDPTTGDNFGVSVAISGTTVVVGAWNDDVGGNDDAGAAYVFDAITGNLTATLTSPEPSNNDMFGIMVAISGTTAVVGERRGDSSRTNGGAAYAYDTVTGNLISSFLNPSPSGADQFGWSVGISGNVAVVGAYAEYPGGIQEGGAAYVFDVPTGNLISTLNNPDPTFNDEFGYSVAVSGTLAVVGARMDDATASDGGTAYVFDTATGNLIATLNNPEPTNNDQFAMDGLAMSGNTAVVSAQFDDPGGVNVAGTAYVFDAFTGNLIATLNNPDPTASDEFGAADVAISGAAILVPAWKDDAGASDAGTAYVFGNAQCANPARAEGTLFYNTSGNVMQYCDGANWVAIGRKPAPSGPDCPNVGDVCGDGAIYAGMSGGNAIYAAPADETTTLQWKTTSTATAGTGSASDGVANTDAVAAAGLAAHPAAQACRNRGAAWYLPAQDELDRLFQSRNAGALTGTFDTLGSFPTSVYWSSTESTTTSNAMHEWFNGGAQSGTQKDQARSVRCVRR